MRDDIDMRFVIIATAMILLVSIPMDASYSSINLDTKDSELLTHASGSTVANVIVTGDNVEHTGTKNVAGHDWDVFRVIINEETTYSTVYFDASQSFGNSTIQQNGIDLYNWTVYFDQPFGDSELIIHEYSEDHTSQGQWSYDFINITVDQEMVYDNQIRLELRVTDEEGNVSEKYRIFFSVVHESYLDSELIFQYDSYQNMTGITGDEIYINGSILQGSENQSDAYVEVAFNLEDLNASAIEKYSLYLENKWAKTSGLNDSDSFSLMLSLDGMYSNETKTQMIYIKSYEGNDMTWATVHWIEISLIACKGLTAPTGAMEDGGEFIFDESIGICLWDGAWTYDPLTGNWTEPEANTELVSVQVIFPVDGILTMSDSMTLHGMVISPTTASGNIHVEAALTSENLNATAVEKYDLSLTQKWAKASDLNNTDQFNITLSLEGEYSNLTLTQTIFFKAYEVDSNYQEINIGYGQVNITLIACQGVVAPSGAIDAGGEFVYDSALGHCIWDGVWTYDHLTNQWDLPISDECDVWEYWNPDLVNPALPGNGCPMYVSDETEDDSEGSGSIPSVSFILTSMTIFLAAIIARRD